MKIVFFLAYFWWWRTQKNWAFWVFLHSVAVNWGGSFIVFYFLELLPPEGFFSPQPVNKAAFSSAGIPIKTTLDNTSTVQYAGLIQQLVLMARSTVRELDPQNDLTFLRVRSKKNEIMIAPGEGRPGTKVRASPQKCWSFQSWTKALF